MTKTNNIQKKRPQKNYTHKNIRKKSKIFKIAAISASALLVTILAIIIIYTQTSQRNRPLDTQEVGAIQSRSIPAIKS